MTAQTILRIDETLGNQTGTLAEPRHDTTGTLPTTLSTRLNTVFGNTTWSSTIIQAAEKTGALTTTDLGSNVIDVAFTESDGDPLVGVASGLTAIDGKEIFLYSDSGTGSTNNLVIGREGMLVNGVYVADPNGAIAFIVYLETNGGGAQGDANATSADLWVVEFTTMQHPDASDPDDSVPLADKLFVSVSNPLDFNLSGAPSGQNLFLMFSDGTPQVDEHGDPDPDEVAIVVTAANAAAGGTVNTGQGGGGTTLGSNNQMLDPPESGKDAESLLFSFVQGANVNYTVPNLTAGEAALEQNIDFNNFFETTSASFTVVQLQPTKKATLTISALEAHLNPNGDSDPSNDTAWDQSLYIDHQLDNDHVNITSVTLTRSVTVKKVTTIYTVTYVDGAPATGTVKVGNGQATAMTADQIAALGLIVTFPGTDVKIAGAIAGDNFKYVTDDDHDRVIITNVGDSTDANLNSAFDIGAFRIESGGLTTSPLDNILFYDDGPDANGTAQSGTVDEDGAPLLAGANPGGPDDNTTAGSAVSGNIAAVFHSGRDGFKAAAFSLSTDTSGLLQTLKSQGATVEYSVANNVLTAYVDSNNNDAYDASTERRVFTLSVDSSTGDYTFTLYDQLDHAAPAAGTSFENELTLNLGSILQAQDKDNDMATGDPTDLVITVDDDSPVINAGTTNIVVANGQAGTGKFSYSIGVDDRDSYTSAATSDLIVSLVSGSVGGTPITIPSNSVQWVSESDTSAVYSFDFTYVSNPTTGQTSTILDSTISFDKAAGTYTVQLSQPIASFSVLSLNSALGFTGYVEGSSSIDSSQPDVSVAQLASNFFVQFRADEEPSGNGDDKPGENGNIDAVPIGTAWSPTAQPANDDAYARGEIFQSSNTWPSVSNSTAGIASDTIQYGEVLDFNFFAANPQGFANPAGVAKTTAGTIFIEFDGLDNGEDLVVLLKLVDSANPGNVTTIPVIVQYGDIFHKAQASSIPAAFGFTGTIDNNDGLVVIEANDYNFLTGASGTWRIAGAQVIASTEGISGEGINLNGAIGGAGGSSAMQSFNSGANAKDSGNSTGGTWDGDVFKIVNIGFVTDITPPATLNFGVQVVDFDRDTTASQTLTVNIDPPSSPIGTSGADTFVMTDIPADLDAALAQETRTLTDFNPNGDVLDFLTDAVAGNFESSAGPFASLSAFVAEADNQLDGTTRYYFGTVGSDGYLAYDGDGVGFTSIVKLVGVTSGFSHDDII
jgi:T1SS-143 domain-containing protein